MSQYTELRAMFLRIAIRESIGDRKWLAEWALNEVGKYQEMNDDDN